MADKNEKIVLYGLLDSCPFGVEQNCHISAARKMGYLKKLEWASSLSDQEVVQIVDKHEKCYDQRLQVVD